MELEFIHGLFLNSKGASTDTRKITPGSMFFALKGENFNANTFASQALEKGASYVIIDEAAYFVDSRTILVADVLETLQQLSTYHRKYLGLPVVALTGSNGKTTTKELINAVLSQKFRTTATVGNLNNHIGVPLTLLSFTGDTQLGIVEMGANHQKEIAFLCDIALPDFGYITNFGKAHLEGFGGVQGVIKGKSEMYDHLRKYDKTAFINSDDVLQVEKSAGITSYTFGTSAADMVVNSISAEPFVIVIVNGEQYNSNLIGLYNAPNICAAIAIGKYFKIESQHIQSAIENYVPQNNRSQLISRGEHQVVLDAYNANPSSMEAAIKHFAQAPAQNKVAVLGDMFELGDESRQEHRRLVDLLSDYPGITVWFIGKDFYACRKDHSAFNFAPDFESFKASFKISGRATILIKGSRGMALERTLELL